MAQEGNSQPSELWTFDPDGDADINDVGIDAAGKVIAAVQGDASAVGNDQEVFAWDLEKSKTSSTPAMRDDPSPSLGDPEGLQAVAVEPNPGGKGDFIAVGHEGSSDANGDNIHVYRRSSGGGSEEPVSGTPDSELVDLWFLDRTRLVAHHESAVALYIRGTGTQYEHASDGPGDVWNPPGDEVVQTAELARDGSRVGVLTSQENNVGDYTLRLRVLDVDTADNTLDEIAEPWNTTVSQEGGQLAFADDGRYALVGSPAQTIYYMGLTDKNDTSGEITKRFSDFPWTRNGPATVSEVALSPKGGSLAAGFGNGELVVYQRTNDNVDRPLAESVVEPIQTPAAPDEMTFADGKRSLYVQAGALLAFHDRQFDGGEVSPLWALPGVTGFAVSDDGQRLALAGSGDNGGTVTAREQTYDAELSVDAPATVRPGRTSNVTVEVTNTGSTFDSYRLGIDGVPGSWSVEKPEDPLELLPGGNGTIDLQVTPGSTQAPGDVSFTVQATSQLGPDKPNVGQADASTRVEEVHAAGLSVDNQQRAIQQGGTVTFDATVENDGNTREQIELSVSQDEDWRVRLDGERTDRHAVELDPGQDETIEVELRAPSDVEKGLRNEVRLTASPEAGGESTSSRIPVVVDPSYGARLTVANDTFEGQPGDRIETELTVANDGNTRDTFTLDVQSNSSNPEHLWRASASETTLTLGGGDEETVTVTVEIPRGATTGESSTITVTATSRATGDQVGSTTYQAVVPQETDDSPIGVLSALAAVGMAALVSRRLK